MKWFIDVVSLSGIADSVLMALNPSAWSRFWGQVLSAVPRDRRLATVLAPTEFGFSLTLLRWNHRHDQRSRWQAQPRMSNERPERKINMNMMRRKAA